MARKLLVPAVVVGCLFAPVFWNYYIWNSHESTDHAGHIAFIRDGSIPSYPFFHWSVLAIALGDDHQLEAAAAISLTLATAAAAALSAAYLSAKSRVSLIGGTITCLLLALAMPLPDWRQFKHITERLSELSWTHGNGIYLGQIAPNVWHNPTSIFAMPFVIALYWVSVRSLTDFSRKTAAGVGILMVLCILAKPNYALALSPCMGLVFLEQRLPIVDKTLRLMAAFLLPVGVLLVQAVLLVGSKGSTGEEMVVAPFEVWGQYSQNIPASVFVGIVFPLCVLLLYRGRFQDELGLKLAWAVLGTAVLQYSLFIESGARTMAGNWSWGTVFADHVLFLASCEYLLRQRTNWKKIVCYGVLVLHAASGAINLARCMRDPGLSVFF
jgi:hypothetical protein